MSRHVLKKHIRRDMNSSLQISPKHSETQQSLFERVELFSAPDTNPHS